MRWRQEGVAHSTSSQLGWDEEEEKLHVILRHVFTLEESIEGGLEFFEDLGTELKEELNKLGTIKGIKIFEHNPEGVVAVKLSARAYDCRWTLILLQVRKG